MTTFAILDHPLRQHETAEMAARDIEIFYPAGWLYEIDRVLGVPPRWAVSVFSDDGRRLGYAFREEER